MTLTTDEGSPAPDFDRDANAHRLQRIAEGDVPAFHDLYADTAPRLLGACVRILGDRHEAEEAMQEAFLTIWRQAGRFDPARGSARAWLATITRNCAVDRLRTRTRLHAAPLDLAEEVADEAPSAPDLLVGREDSARLASCVELLGSDERLLIRMAFLQGSTYSELASRSGRPLGTVKSRIRRALIKLAECLQ